MASRFRGRASCARIRCSPSHCCTLVAPLSSNQLNNTPLFFYFSLPLQTRYQMYTMAMPHDPFSKTSPFTTECDVWQYTSLLQPSSIPSIIASAHKSTGTADEFEKTTERIRKTTERSMPPPPSFVYVMKDTYARNTLFLRSA